MAARNAAQVTRLTKRSPPEISQVCSAKYSASGWRLIWLKYGVGKNATLPACAQ